MDLHVTTFGGGSGAMENNGDAEFGEVNDVRNSVSHYKLMMVSEPYFDFSTAGFEVFELHGMIHEALKAVEATDFSISRLYVARKNRQKRDDLSYYTSVVLV